ncbi:MAG TPA: DUF192 domain-containing protein [Rhizomicrobium sp.]|jgi:hypothetical protein|nr:DUF192 domain-containing protein [Rhizomicrobium sp.]
MLRRSFLLLFALLGVATVAHAQSLQTFDRSTLTIDTAQGPRHFAVELAVTPGQEEQGLMYRRELAPDAGMLFDFGDTATRTFWMKNTLIPLDMLFIAGDGRIVDIHERAVPMSEDIIASQVPARAVLELNGGTVARLGIKPGDIVRYKGFGNGGG